MPKLKSDILDDFQTLWCWFLPLVLSTHFSESLIFDQKFQRFSHFNLTILFRKKKKNETNFAHIEILNRASYLKLVRIIYLNVCTKIIQYFKKCRFLATSGRTSRHWKNPKKIQFWSFFHHRRLLKLIFWARNGCLE